MVPIFAFADGGLIPPPNKRVFETNQKAVIFYDNKVEDLILSVSFRGDAEDFGWIVPTPEKPEVSKASEEIFTSLDEITRPKKEYMHPASGRFKDSNQKIEEEVRIVETKKIEYYNITVLQAGDSEVLADWLNENDYQFPIEGRYILDNYIKNNWYFTAVKIDADAKNLVEDSLNNRFYSGHMVPLRLKFNSDKIVYPLKISSVMQYNKYKSVSSAPDRAPVSRRVPYYPNRVSILLYVFTSDHKQHLPGFNVQYAGWIKEDTIKKMAYDDNGESWLNPKRDKYFLTKMYRSMSYSQMNHDLYLRNASDNELVNAEPLEQKENQRDSMFWFWLLMAVSGFIIVVLSLSFIYFLKK